MKFGQINIAVMLIALFTIVVSAQEPQLVDETVARVNSDIITRSQLLRAQEQYRQALAQKFNNDEAKVKEEYDKNSGTLLEVLIQDKLIAQRAQELSIDVEPEVNRYILEFAKQSGYTDLNLFQEKLREAGLDVEDIRKTYRQELQQRAVFFREVISPIYDKLKIEEKREWYEKHQDRYRVPGEIKISELYIPYENRSEAEADALARQVIGEARAGKPFAELVKLHSDPKRSSYEKGGELPPYKDQDLRADLRAIVEKMKPGEVSEPIKTDKGIQILRLNEFKAQSVLDFAEVENDVSQELAFEKGNVQVKDYIKKLKEKSYIRIAEAYKPGEQPAKP